MVFKREGQNSVRKNYRVKKMFIGRNVIKTSEVEVGKGSKVMP